MSRHGVATDEFNTRPARPHEAVGDRLPAEGLRSGPESNHLEHIGDRHPPQSACHHNTRESAIPVAQIGGRISGQTTNRVIARVRWFLLPSDPIPREDRVGWLDGMRGIAAVQVVLLHYATAFLPGLGLHDRAMMHHRWEQIDRRHTAVLGPERLWCGLSVFPAQRRGADLLVRAATFRRGAMDAAPHHTSWPADVRGDPAVRHPDFDVALGPYQSGTAHRVVLVAWRGIAPGGDGSDGDPSDDAGRHGRRLSRDQCAAGLGDQATRPR